MVEKTKSRRSPEMRSEKGPPQAGLLDGKFVAQKILEKAKAEVKQLKKKNIYPKLAIILVGKNSSSLAYIRQKEKACETVGVSYMPLHLSNKISTKTLIKKIESLNRNKNIHGILVQMPLPSHIETPKIIKAINPDKDVDGFHAYNVGKMFISVEFEALVPCTPVGVIKLLEFYRIPIAGKVAVVIGRSNIVGKPLAVMLLNRGATVIICNRLTKNLAKYAKQADILCAAAGVPGLIVGNMVKKGCTVIDVGFTRKEGKIFGDVDFGSARKRARWITPVPGGVGPMTVACLMENVVKAAKKQEP